MPQLIAYPVVRFVALEADDDSEVVELLMIRAETTPVALEINEKTNSCDDNHGTKCYCHGQ